MIAFKSIKSRMLVMVSIPLLALLVAGAYIAHQSLATYRNYAKINSIADVILKGNALVHELQKERGRSSGFFNSKGAQFGGELKTQRGLSDKNLAEFKDAVAKLTYGKDDERFRGNIGNAQELLAKLPQNRSGIDNLSGSVDDYLKYYTGAIAALIKLNGEFVAISRADDKFYGLTTSYYDLLEYKERTGLTRAVFSGVFSKDAFSKSLLFKAVELRKESNIYLANFENHSSKENLAFFRNTVSGEDVKKVDALIAYALENSEQQKLGVSAATWFDAITNKINLVKKVEDNMAKNILTLAVKSKDGSRNSMIAMVSFLVLFIAAMIYYLLNQVDVIVRPIRRAAYIAQEIAQGNIQAMENFLRNK